jgi:hypothetical protein
MYGEEMVWSNFLVCFLFQSLMRFTHLHTQLDNFFRVEAETILCFGILFWQLLCSHNTGCSQMVYTESDIFL